MLYYLCSEAGGGGETKSRGGGQEAQGGAGAADLHEHEGITVSTERPRQRGESLAGFM